MSFLHKAVSSSVEAETQAQRWKQVLNVTEQGRTDVYKQKTTNTLRARMRNTLIIIT